MSANTEEEVKQWCEKQEYSKIASFFTKLAGSPESARAVLENALNCLPDGTASNKKRPAPSSTSVGAQGHSYFVQDLTDDAIVTSLLQIPNDPAAIGAIIGPQGKHIKHVTQTTGCVVNLDQKSHSATSRTAPITVFLQGPLRSVMKAAELLSAKLESVINEWTGTNQWATTGSGVNRTCMIIPDSLVKRVIGKGGVTVSKLQQDSRAEVQLQNEAKMRASPDPLFGREALFTGPLDARMHAMYLVCRMLLDDKESPQAWKTSNVFPAPIRGAAVPGAGVMTPKGMIGHAGLAPPLPQHMQQNANPFAFNPQQAGGSTAYGAQQPIGSQPLSGMRVMPGFGHQHQQPPIQPPHPSQSQHLAPGAGMQQFGHPQAMQQQQQLHQHPLFQTSPMGLSMQHKK